jgi:hypothetical protein
VPTVEYSELIWFAFVVSTPCTSGEIVPDPTAGNIADSALASIDCRPVCSDEYVGVLDELLDDCVLLLDPPVDPPKLSPTCELLPRNSHCHRIERFPAADRMASQRAFEPRPTPQPERDRQPVVGRDQPQNLERSAGLEQPRARRPRRHSRLHDSSEVRGE